MPTDVLIPMVVMMAPIVAVPATEPVACKKMDMNGKPVGDSSAASMSPRQKSKAMSMLNPSVPLIATLSMMDRGTSTGALVISSDIYITTDVSTRDETSHRERRGGGKKDPT